MYVCVYMYVLIFLAATILVMDGVVMDFGVFCLKECAECDNQKCKSYIQAFAFISGAVICFIVVYIHTHTYLSICFTQIHLWLPSMQIHTNIFICIRVCIHFHILY